MDVFLRNGFDFKDDPASGRLLLSAVPFRCGAARAVGCWAWEAEQSRKRCVAGSISLAHPASMQPR